MPGEWWSLPAGRHEVRPPVMEPDLPLLARVDAVVVEGAQQHAIVDVRPAVVAAVPLDVVCVAPGDRCPAARPCAAAVAGGDRLLLRRREEADGPAEPQRLATRAVHEVAEPAAADEAFHGGDRQAGEHALGVALAGAGLE